MPDQVTSPEETTLYGFLNSTELRKAIGPNPRAESSSKGATGFSVDYLISGSVYWQIPAVLMKLLVGSFGSRGWERKGR